ncbi:MAG: hypothetical protein RR365_03905 [Bacteroides sp.]
MSERRKTRLIRIISARSDRYGNLLIDFMEHYGLSCLMDATEGQFTEYIHDNLKGAQTT